MALEAPELSPRELAVRFTDQEHHFVSEASVYRLLKAHDLITNPAFIVVKAADEFHTKTTAPNQLWQTDFTYLKVIDRGWFYLSTVLDDFSRYIIAWKLCTTMAASDVTETLETALAASGCDQAKVLHRPPLLSDNGRCYVADGLAKWLDEKCMAHVRGAPGHLVEHYNHQHYHGSLPNLTPADVYLGQGQSILLERKRIRRQSLRYASALSVPKQPTTNIFEQLGTAQCLFLLENPAAAARA